MSEVNHRHVSAPSSLSLRTTAAGRPDEAESDRAVDRRPASASGTNNRHRIGGGPGVSEDGDYHHTQYEGCEQQCNGRTQIVWPTSLWIKDIAYLPLVACLRRVPGSGASVQSSGK